VDSVGRSALGSMVALNAFCGWVSWFGVLVVGWGTNTADDLMDVS